MSEAAWEVTSQPIRLAPHLSCALTDELGVCRSGQGRKKRVSTASMSSMLSREGPRGRRDAGEPACRSTTDNRLPDATLVCSASPGASQVRAPNGVWSVRSGVDEEAHALTSVEGVAAVLGEPLAELVARELVSPCCCEERVLGRDGDLVRLFRAREASRSQWTGHGAGAVVGGYARSARAWSL